MLFVVKSSLILVMTLHMFLKSQNDGNELSRRSALLNIQNMGQIDYFQAAQLRCRSLWHKPLAHPIITGTLVRMLLYFDALPAERQRTVLLMSRDLGSMGHEQTAELARHIAQLVASG